MSDFCHLHCHSEFSLLDGLASVDDLVGRAVELGQNAVALTDHGVMHGVIPFARAAKGAGIKPIIGTEAYITQYGRPMSGRNSQLDRKSNHLLLLAENQTGYKNLLKISSTAQLEGYYYNPRIDAEFLEQRATGLITTTGCMAGEVPSLLNTEDGPGNEKKALERFLWYRELFGKERFYVELQEHSIPELQKINKVLVEWAKKYDVPMLVTNDAHYARGDDAEMHDTLLCVQTRSTKNDVKRMRYSDQGYYLKSRAELEAAFRPFIDLPSSAYDNSLLIAEMCNTDIEDSTFHLPDIEIPEGHTYQTYLRELTYAGLINRYGERASDAEVVERTEMELGIINDMGFDVYFIIVWDLCKAMKARNIWWNVRGSGAGSIVAYATEITLIDPLEHHLIFQRFLNPGRISMPDFDLDIPDDSREEMIRYTIEKYGSDRVAQIAAFGRMKARAAVRDVGRALDIPLAEVDRVAKMIPAIPGKPVTIEKSLTEGNEFYSPDLAEIYSKNQQIRELIDSAQKIEGVARHSSTHAAAVIVTDRPIDEYVPMLRPQKAVITNGITQFEFPICESIGLLKVDFLGLATLSIMREASDLIYARHGKRYSLNNIPRNHSESFKLLAGGEVTGVFQVESAGMRRILADMQPHNFQHIMAVVALYRPGPLAFIPNFIDRLHGREEITYRHPELEPILSETLGIIVYQEQIMRIATDLSGYNASEADFMRKAVAKKKEKDLLKHKSLMTEGAAKRGISAETMEAIFGDIEAFARYGFPKAHAADYAVITVQTAYLKALYPVEYMAALLLIERDKSEKVTNFINECRRMGIDVLPPDINYSGLDFDIQERPPGIESMSQRDRNLGYDFQVPEGSAIRFGMAAVKNVGEGPVSVILEARKEGGHFTSLENFCERVDMRQVNKRALECLIKVGALDCFGQRNQLIDALEQIMKYSGSIHNERDTGQLSMFDLIEAVDDQPSVTIQLKPIEDLSHRERLQWEKELLGVYAMSHPMQHVSVNMAGIVSCVSNELNESFNGKNITMAGMISSIRTIFTKKGDPMAFLQLEDMQGQFEVVVFPRTYEEYKDKLIADEVIMVKGKGQSRENQTTLLADTIHSQVEKAIAKDEPVQTEFSSTVPTLNGLDVGASGAGVYEPAENDSTPVNATPYPDEPPAYLDAPPPGFYEASPFVSPPSPEAEIEPKIKSVKMAKNDNHAESSSTVPSTTVPSTTVSNNGHQNDSINRQPEKNISVLREKNENGYSVPSSNGVEKPDAPQNEATKSEAIESEVIESEPVVNLPITEIKIAAPQPMPSAVHSNGSQNGKYRSLIPKTEPAMPPSLRDDARQLYITFRRSDSTSRDKFRLKELYERVYNPRGRDQFMIRLDTNGQQYELAFPNDPCQINERLVNELEKHFRVEVQVKEL